jgi:hypothetical protein
LPLACGVTIEVPSANTVPGDSFGGEAVMLPRWLAAQLKVEV